LNKQNPTVTKYILPVPPITREIECKRQVKKDRNTVDC